MNDVSQCDVIIWHFDVQIYAQFDWLNILYVQAKLVKIEIEPTKLL